MVWPLPSYPELENYVKSEIADIRNIGLPKGVAGTLTAAEFLRRAKIKNREYKTGIYLTCTRGTR